MSNSHTEGSHIPPKARAQGAERTFVYNGPSMTPTFRPGHMLYVRPEAHDLAAGDVVVFTDPNRDGTVVHRVVAATPAGLVTRGDYNLHYDPLPVAYGQVVGKVESADFGGSFKQVTGGQYGLWAARVRWAVLGILARMRTVLGFPYRALKRSPTARGWLRCFFKPHFETIVLQTPQGVLVKIRHRGRVVARGQPGGVRFECHKPYDLLLGESDFKLHLDEQNTIQ